MSESFDVVVMGSGAAGLTAALFAAHAGARVLVLEKSDRVGGTSAISGGQVWIPNNRFMGPAGDSTEAARRYLSAVTLGEVDAGLIDAFLQAAPAMLTALEQLTPLRFFQVQRHDYHSEWPGAAHGRSLEPLPLDLAPLGDWAKRLRRSPYRLALTSAEAKAGQGPELAAERDRLGLVTQGIALVAGLLQGCLALGVTVRCSAAVRESRIEGADGLSLAVASQGSIQHLGAKRLVFASGGFEWNAAFERAFLACPDDAAASPPHNTGDALRIGLAAGAAVAHMTQSWWSAAFRIPGERYDGELLTRNMVRELALPGSVLVNADGRRFANEAASYNALGKAFQQFDPQRNAYVNKRAWLVFDHRFKSRYTVATVAAGAAAPDWFVQAGSVADLAQRTGIDAGALEATLQRFNDMADAGRDLDFGRGDARHDRYHGDPREPHPNLGAIRQAPFYAVPVFLGNLGTKGGLVTRALGEVVDVENRVLPRLYACGNAAASWMGPGYPGAGGSLGPIMAAAFLCGSAARFSRTGASLQTALPHGQR